MAVDVAYEIAKKAPIERRFMIRSGIEFSYTHPQHRTMRFHEFYGAPIGDGIFDKKKLNRQFSHMTDERVAFRLAFILEEFREILKDGFGIHTQLLFSNRTDDDWVTSFSTFHESAHKCIERVMNITQKRDLVEVVDGLGDLNVVVNGFAIELGVDMNAVDREIAASNFTKADENGEPIVNEVILIDDGNVPAYETLRDPNQPIGKVLKGPNFVKPNIAALLGFEDE